MPIATHRHRRTLAGLALLTTVGLTTMTACGQSAAPVAAPTAADAKQASDESATDPCTLLGPDQLAEALGTPPSQQGAATEQARGLTCAWTFVDPGSALGDGTMSITTWHGREFFASGTIGDPLAGLADEAQADPAIGVVQFRSGDEVVQVQVSSPARSDRAVVLARAAAATL
jgi:hypothetical protein